ncbi:MAG: AIPR family protein [Deltaproteobacteria bacterium]|nr:AIPR family protein [Deltaproteobacteria bacterium]
MVSNKLSESDLSRELESFKEIYPKLSQDELFVLSFLRAFVTDDEKAAVDSLTGVSGDKGADAILIDDKTKDVFIVQGKFRERIGGKNEKRSDITSFADIAVRLSGKKDEFDSLVENSESRVRERLREARERIVKRNYRLQLYYATLGKCSEGLEKEAISIVRTAECQAGIEICSDKKIMHLLADYIEGVAPPVPGLDLEMESGHGVSVNGTLQRYDSKTDIESWVFSMSGRAVADIFERSGPRVFARNVRGFLENTEVNRSMQETLKHQPEYFWYYNNGITMICDAAEKRSSKGKDILHVDNPQIINGQQTTRTLHKMIERAPEASVPVRVIRIPREVEEDHQHFENLVSSIVRATNWQNAIRASDLMSNDRRQIEIERAFRKLRYLYIRKRQSKSEVRSIAGANRFFTVTKEEIAQAVAACDLDPATLRLGKERLFEEDYYQFVFPNADPNYYLKRYWLMKCVGKAAKGYPERAYAKWLVLHFMWKQIKGLLKTKSISNTFRELHENNDDILKTLRRAINAVFNASLAFYRKKRGKGATAIDVSSFFRRRGLPTEFETFWSGSSNRYRGSFKKSWARFEKLLYEAQE